MSDAIVVFMTSANADEARRIANELVERQLAACVQILPEIESVYRWKGEVRRDTELLVLAKTTAAQFDDLERAVREIHSYDTPEIVAVQITAASSKYISWLVSCVSSRVVERE